MSWVLIAPDKFKGTLTATQVAAHVAAGLEKARPGVSTVLVPVADGGDGTVDAAVAAGYRRIEIGVRGPTSKPVSAAFALDGTTAVIEAAQACGLSLLPDGEFAPLTATTRGVGELILAAVRMRATRIVLGLGGTATTDGGAGFVVALGGRLYDSEHHELPPGGGSLGPLDQLDLSGIEFIVATDVDNPLLGPDGAAAVYGPQKGAAEADVETLEAGLTRWADAVEALGRDGLGGEAATGPGPGSGPDPGSIRRLRDIPGAGAAGGLGFAAMAFLGARVEPGISLLLNLLSFPSRLEGASLVITGEGALDEQTLRGKAPAGVARVAAEHSVPVVAVAGMTSLSPGQLATAHIERAYALTDIEPDVARCRSEAGPLLESLASKIADDWLAT
jgi:glycerate kinase